MSDHPLSEWIEGPVYATITEAGVAAAQKLVGTNWTYTGPWVDAAKIGGEVSVGLQDGVELIGRIDTVEDGRMAGVIVKAQAAPPPPDDWDHWYDWDDWELDARLDNSR